MTKTRQYPADSKKATEETSYEVEILSLDYLAFKALESIKFPGDERMQGRKRDANGNIKPHRMQESGEDVEEHLRLVDTFLTIFYAHHSQSQIPPTTLFRLKLLRFSALVYYATAASLSPPSETTPTLTALRQHNRTRAQKWWDCTRASLPEHDAADLLAFALSTLDAIDAASDSSSTDDSNEGSAPTLLDLLPLFIALSADRANLDGDSVMKPEWLRLVLEFMAHAFLEQRVEGGARGPTALLEAFAWGPVGVEEVEDAELHGLFLVEERGDGEEGRASVESGEGELSAKGFWVQRERVLRRLDPRTDRESAERMGAEELDEWYKSLTTSEDLVSGFSRREFERRLWRFVEALGKSVDVPLLRQLEQVQDGVRTRIDVEGRRMGEEETERLRCVWAGES